MLIAAGPPASAIHPVKSGKGVQTLGQLSDWLPRLRRATRDNLEGTFEAALQATRSMIEAGQVVSAEDATGLGDTVGERLRLLARLGRTGHGGHFDAVMTLQRLYAIVKALGGLGPPETASEFR